MASRTKKAAYNILFELMFEIVTAVSSFILPRLILTHFGSTYNGLTTSISQFISCIALLKSGIGSVTRAALYKPLATNDTSGISEIVNATSKFMQKVALVFACGALFFAAIYPFVVIDEFPWLFSFSLILILSISTFVQYYFGLPYQMVLQADQKNYIIAIVSIFTTILNTIVASVLILMGCGIHIVKLGSAAVFILQPVFYSTWVRKKYAIRTNVRPNDSLLEQRWDAFGHQVANFINNNTDIVVTTLILGVVEVSVYSVYHMISSAVYKGVTAIATGTAAAFGNMLAKKENNTLNKRFTQFKLVIFYIATTLFTICALLITPFVTVYTGGVTDADYNRVLFGYLLCLSAYFMSVKLPFEQMIFAAGEFRRTKNGAYIEAGINIVVSVALAFFIGIEGVIIGTVVAISYRTIRYSIFVSRNIVHGNRLEILYYFFYSGIVFTISFFAVKLFPLMQVNSYSGWFVLALEVGPTVLLISTLLMLLMFNKSAIELFRYVVKLIFGEKVHKGANDEFF